MLTSPQITGIPDKVISQLSALSGGNAAEMARFQAILPQIKADISAVTTNGVSVQVAINIPETGGVSQAWNVRPISLAI